MLREALSCPQHGEGLLPGLGEMRGLCCPRKAPEGGLTGVVWDKRHNVK